MRLPPSSGARIRLGIAAALAAGFVAAFVVDGIGPRAMLPVSAVRPQQGAGVWGCPVVASGTSGGWVDLVNTSTSPSQVEIGWVRPPLPAATSRLTLPGLRAAAVRSPASPQGGMSAVVRWSGGRVVASATGTGATLVRPSASFGSACARPDDAPLVAPALSTASGSDASIVVSNPTDADAMVDVSFVADGDETQPENSRGRVVPARGRIVIDAGSFVFDQPQFAAVVHPTTGSVVAAALITSSSGLELVPASRSLTLAVAAGEPGFAGRLGVVAVGDDAATADAAGITVNARSALAGFPTGLDPDGPASVALPNVFPFAVTLDERAGSPLAAAMVWGLRIRGGGDIGAVPAVAPANEWTIVAGPPATPDRLHLVIANPSDSPVVVRCRLFTPNAAIDPPGLAALTILPGRAVSIVLSQAAVVPVGVELTSTGPAIAAAIVGVSGNGPATAVYGLAGVAEASPRPVDVEVDPRAGADAR